MPLPGKRPVKKNERAKVSSVSTAFDINPLGTNYSRHINRTVGKRPLVQRVHFNRHVNGIFEGRVTIGRNKKSSLAEAEFQMEYDWKGNRVRLFGIQINPAYRGQGLTQQMLAEIINIVKTDTPARKVILDVETDNMDAIKSYSTFGFKKTGKKSFANEKPCLEMVYEIK